MSSIRDYLLAWYCDGTVLIQQTSAELDDDGQVVYINHGPQVATFPVIGDELTGIHANDVDDALAARGYRRVKPWEYAGDQMCAEVEADDEHRQAVLLGMWPHLVAEAESQRRADERRPDDDVGEWDRMIGLGGGSPTE